MVTSSTSSRVGKKWECLCGLIQLLENRRGVIYTYQERMILVS
jgi:hypothetical protein